MYMSLVLAQALAKGTREYGDSWRRRAHPVDPPGSRSQTQGADSTENMSRHKSPVDLITNHHNTCGARRAHRRTCWSCAIMRAGFIAQASAEGLRPYLQNLYQTRLTVLHSVTAAFVSGYHDGLSDGKPA